MTSIRLSEKHGVNPTIPVCFWCGESKNEILLLGKLPGDQEAPHNAVFNYEPCDECKNRMAQGITIIEATQTRSAATLREIQPGVWPTGRWAVLTERAVQRLFNLDVLPAIQRHRKAFMDPETCNKLGLFTKVV